MSHVLFADESRHNQGQFRAVGVVSARRAAAVHLHRWLRAALDAAGISSLEFKYLKDGRRYRLAQSALNELVPRLANGNLRLDVLLWDTTDHRHAICGRDDRANLQRMYYHCLRVCLDRRWPSESRWKAYIDEGALPCYDEFARILRGKTFREVRQESLAGEGQRWEHSYHVESVSSANSDHQLLIQLADLITGLAAASHLRFDALTNQGQEDLFAPATKPTKTERHQFDLIRLLKDLADEQRLGLSLRSTRGLQTHDARHPLNIWRYRPAHYDAAPTRRSP